MQEDGHHLPNRLFIPTFYLMTCNKLDLYDNEFLLIVRLAFRWFSDKWLRSKILLLLNLSKNLINRSIQFHLNLNNTETLLLQELIKNWWDKEIVKKHVQSMLHYFEAFKNVENQRLEFSLVLGLIINGVLSFTIFKHHCSLRT